MVGDGAQAPEALLPPAAPVHGLQDAQRLPDLAATQALLQQRPVTYVAPTQNTWEAELQGHRYVKQSQNNSDYTRTQNVPLQLDIKM